MSAQPSNKGNDQGAPTKQRNKEEREAKHNSNDSNTQQPFDPGHDQPPSDDAQQTIRQ